MKRNEAEPDFDVAPGDDIPSQGDVRPEGPVRSVGELAEFLTELESVFGRVERPVRPILGDRFLL